MSQNGSGTKKRSLLGHIANWLNPGRLLWAVGMTFFLTGILFPFFWMFSTAFKSYPEISGYKPTYIPSGFRLDAFRELFDPASSPFWNFGQNLLNSLRVAAPTAILAVILSLLGAYAIARLRFPGKEYFLNGVLLVYLFPGVLLVVPLFAMLSQLGSVIGFSIQDNLWILTLTYLAKTLPVAIYMLTNYFKSIPASIEEQGLVDGCSRLGVIRYITIPLSIPSLVTIATYTFMIAWNEFLYALVFLNSSDKLTVPIKISTIFNAPTPRPNVVMAASTITTIPIVILYLSIQRYLQEGLTAGATD